LSHFPVLYFEIGSLELFVGAGLEP
jgi:hypothetical protein